MPLIKKNAVFLCLLGVIYTLAWFIQDKLFLNWDVATLMQSAKSMMAGGVYVKDFFTPNPPLILYLYMPPILLSQYFSISIAIVFRLYMFALVTGSLFISYPLIKKIFSDQISLARLFTATLVGILLIIPLHHLGQRDHLLLIFIMPYLLLVASRLANNKPSVHQAILIGILAGIGFAIKPHFMATFILIELYYAYKKKSLFAWVRAESLAIIGVISLYSIAIVIFYPAYIFSLVPFMLNNYYSLLGTHWDKLILVTPVLFCLIPISLYIIQFRENKYQSLSTILLIALIGFLISYISQQTMLFYHLIPEFSVAILLLVLMLTTLASNVRNIFILILSIFVFSIPAGAEYEVYKFGIAYKERILNKLITFIQTQPSNQSIYVLSILGNYGFPLVNYTHTQYTGRFDCLWMSMALLQIQRTQGDTALRVYLQQNHDKNFFLNMMVEDLKIYKPNLILVDDSKLNNQLNGVDMHFNYLSYFLENSDFKEQWKSYRYLTTLEDNYFHSKLEIYARI
jgi:hypothetical protein